MYLYSLFILYGGGVSSSRWRDPYRPPHVSYKYLRVHLTRTYRQYLVPYRVLVCWLPQPAVCITHVCADITTGIILFERTHVGKAPIAQVSPGRYRNGAPTTPGSSSRPALSGSVAGLGYRHAPPKIDGDDDSLDSSLAPAAAHQATGMVL
jgi:hypothetical protein